MELKSQKDVLSFYEALGSELDIKRYRLDTSWKVQVLLKVMPNERFSSVLEVGCGGALVLRGISEAIKADKMIGMDISTSMLTVARRECQGYFVRGDAERLPFKDDSIDLVLLSDILEHVGHPTILLKESRRVGKCIAFKIPLEKCLMRRGALYGLGYHKSGHLCSWNKKDALSLLSGAGLRIARYRLVDPPEEILYYGRVTKPSQSAPRESARRQRFSAKRILDEEGVKALVRKSFRAIVFIILAKIALEKVTYRHARGIYRHLYGSTLVAFAKVKQT